MLSRLTTYYFTALNNGAGMLATQEGRWPTFDFYNIMIWMYNLPFGIGAAAHETLLQRGPPGVEFLVRWADVEFNNLSGCSPSFTTSGTSEARSIFACLASSLERSIARW